MKKYFLYGTLLIMVVGCKNPFQATTEDSPADFSIQSTESGKVLLRLQPEVGSKNMMEMKVELKPSGMMIPLNSTIIANLQMNAAQVTDSTTSYHIDFQRMRMDASVLGAKINYDSQGENSNIPAEIKNQVEPLLAKKVVMEMNHLARVSSLSFDEKKSANSTIDLNALFIPLPEEEVGVGDSWTSTQDFQNVENTDLTYSVDRISATEVLVKVRQTDTENKQSHVEGQYLIDRKTGFTKDGVLNIETQQNGQGMRIKITVDSVEELK